MALPRETKIGRYELLIELGRGGMAELFLGRLHGAGGFAKLVAIKRILPHLAQDKQFTELFLNEGQIAARLSHPNVCQVFELDDDNGSLYLAMEYLDGVSWDVLSKAAPQAKVLGLTAGVLAQAAEGLHYAHTLHDLEGKATAIVHRDVSPQNLFVTVDGLCKVLDFGVAKLMTDGPRTRSGVVKGKLPYMAPEQIRGEPVDARTDVFSLGVCAWEALANERLFDRATDFLIWKAVTEEDAPTIASRWPQCPPAVDAAVRRALDREAANRFPSARAFADALRAAVPDALGPTDIADVMRSACGDQIAARAQRVATAVSTRRSLPFADPAAVEPDSTSTPSASESAAATIDIARSAAETADDKAKLHSAPNDTTDLRIRDHSVVIRRADSSDLLPPRSRTGLVIGALAALAVITVVALAMTLSPSRVDPSLAAPSASNPSGTSNPSGASGTSGPSNPSGASSPSAGPSGASNPSGTSSPSSPSGSASSPSGASSPSASSPPSVPVVAKPTRRGAPASTPTPAATKTEPAAEPGFFSVNSDPYATIFVDGKRLGDTPLYREPIAAGPHRVRAVRADGRERTFAIKVPPGKELNSGKLVW